MTKSPRVSEWKDDPVKWVEDELGYTLDQWQKRFLRDERRQQTICCARKSGKTSMGMAKAVHFAKFNQGVTVVIFSAESEQAKEDLHICSEYCHRCEHPISALISESMTMLRFANGSRIISTTTSERSIRGHNPDMVIEDEAAQISDDIFIAAKPALAAKNGIYIMLSTPRGRSGHFFDAHHNPAWSHTTIPADEIPRISPETLARERSNMTPEYYDQEFNCVFNDAHLGANYGVKLSSILTYHQAPVFECVVQAYDTAGKDKEVSDYSVCVTLGLFKGNVFLIDIWAEQATYYDLKTAVHHNYEMHHPDAMVIEDASNGIALLSELQNADEFKAFGGRAIAAKATKNKGLRWAPVSAFIENGRFHVPDHEFAFKKQLLEQLTQFPHAANDDILDALVHGVTYLMERSTDASSGYNTEDWQACVGGTCPNLFGYEELGELDQQRTAEESEKWWLDRD